MVAGSMSSTLMRLIKNKFKTTVSLCLLKPAHIFHSSKMKFYLICAIVTFIVLVNQEKFVKAETVVSRSKRASQRYTNKYDNIDIDRILQSKRLLLNYINCLLDKRPCSPEGAELKKVLPEALATDCAKCSESQKKIAGKILYFVLLNYRNEWNQLIDKYDPEGIYREKYEIDEDYDYSNLDSA